MKILNELLDIASNKDLELKLKKIHEHFVDLRETLEKTLNEGMMSDHRGDLEKEFDETEKRLIAARRALGTLNSNKLSPDATREHKSKVMKYINAFRKKLYDIMIQMGMSDREIEYHLDRIGADRAYGKPSELFSRSEKYDDRRNQRRNLR